MKNFLNTEQGVPIRIDPRQLPMHIVLESKDGKREYVLRINNERTKLLLNKK